ncbi:phenylalanine--tRNA ligase subunit beta [Albibacterium bauzanense]|uniref:Phenylalanine--tRNA ligase beta subunit n=1 Tax=Albibacterium bauzanense TaxID=653929 RepID=A0A4R1LYK2_9SPHI|nr:phenylalanine--tRNA ligase subunit beta [Albibacterium bauzanense]TCK83680.1 phenylalanyl-tRNA synthetase beta subunit [Albibacterium bauzanense]
MRISYNWLKDFLKIDKSPEELSEILTNIGLEVESVEEVEDIPGGLAGLVIAEVLSCEQHPNADRLRITTVNNGNESPLQVVCGAPNVAKGQKVILAGVGTTVFPLEGEPFKIKESKIRGELSQGMICAEDEIGLGKSHDGILVLPSDAKVGVLAKDHFNIQSDSIFEIGLTPNRSDAASHLGVARDVAAFLRKDFKLPDVSAVGFDDSQNEVKVSIEDEAACPRYTSLTIKGITVKESPEWLKNRLLAIGVRPINNIVDITNYVLHELGQPLHAFDADQIVGKQIIVKTLPEGTSFITLDEIERKLSSNDLMICDTEKALCIAGVFGGLSSGIKESTTSVFLESAYFNAVSVRKTSKYHGLKTDASFRFERGTDPDITVFALQRAAKLILELAGGEIIGGISDIYPNPIKPINVSVTYRNVQKLIGKEIPKEEIKAIIESLGIRVLGDNGEVLEVEVPPYRVDVTREVDIVEEVLRLYGYNNIEISQQIKASLNTSPKPDRELIENQISDLLIGNGFHEILNNSLTKIAYADKPDEAVRIINPLSSDLDTMRQSLLYSGLEVIAYNQKRKVPDLKLFEFGKVYYKLPNGYNENKRLGVFLTGDMHREQWNNIDERASFFDLKGIVDGILGRLNIKKFQTRDVTIDAFSYGLTYARGEQIFVNFGAIDKKVLKQVDVQGEIFYADFNWDIILKSITNNKIVYKEVSKFPSIRRDLAILVDEKVSFASLKGIAEKTERKILHEVNVFDVYQGDKLPEGKKSYALSFIFQDEEKTLTDKQIDLVIQKFILNFEKELNAEIRK